MDYKTYNYFKKIGLTCTIASMIYPIFGNNNVLILLNSLIAIVNGIDSLRGGEKNTKDIKELTYLYNKVIDDYAKLMIELKITDSIELAKVFYLVMKDGDLTYQQQMNFHNDKKFEINNLGLNILDYGGCCRNISSIYDDILKRMKYVASKLTVYSHGVNDKFNIIENTIGNHVINQINNDNRTYFVDPTNDDYLFYLNDMKRFFYLCHLESVKRKPGDILVFHNFKKLPILTQELPQDVLNHRLEASQIYNKNGEAFTDFYEDHQDIYGVVHDKMHTLSLIKKYKYVMIYK